MYFSVVVLVLIKALVTDICHTLNVTVTPGPAVFVTESENLTLSCLVSQRKRSNSVLILRWFFSPLTPPPPSSTPPTSPPAPGPPQFMIVRMGIKKMKQYGNYTRRFPRPKFRLYDDDDDGDGELYRLLILGVTGMDQGSYSCRVQEIRKHKNTWRASSNGTSATQLTESPADEGGGVPTETCQAQDLEQLRCYHICSGARSAQGPSPADDVTLLHFNPDDGSGEGAGFLFADVFLCAVLICSMGLLSIFMFTLILICQYFHRRHRLKASYLLVKCPESSSGETVTSSSSCSSSSPRAPRKNTGQKADRGVTATPPKPPTEPLPHTPTKVPVAAKRPQKPRRLKTQQRRSATPRALQEDSLTYAELELVRPRRGPPASSTPHTPPTVPDTVYAQILFQEEKL